MEAGSQLKIDVLTKEMALNEENLIKDVDVQLEQTFNEMFFVDSKICELLF